ncbi:D5-like helicase-primase [Yasminevirus sp. GU-2018]|uniref:D5-like helicase-primase n=1 Tax=Yasminevirus sp. GU-2018 TaxID=2420051 RepID=A0A5K0UAT3_9VIRU|nr:D5-like helicase-primase [Yasminevirus sp. GU-2018]
MEPVEIQSQQKSDSQTKHDLSRSPDHVKNLLSILKPNRVSNHYGLVVLASVIKNTDEKLYDSMIEYLGKSKYKPSLEEIQQVWAKETLPKFTVASLEWWLIEDDKPLYLRTVANSLKQIYIKDLYTFQDVSLMILATFGRMYKVGKLTSSWGSKPVSYVFTDGRWRRSDMWHIDLNVIDALHYQLSSLLSELVTTQGESVRGLVKSISSVLQKLGSVAFVQNVVRNVTYSISGNSSDKNLLDALDSDVNLIGFNNGVYDLSIKAFRQSTPDDMVSLTTGNDYVADDLTESDEFKKQKRELDEYLSKVFVDESVRTHILKSLAMTLAGRRVDIVSENNMSDETVDDTSDNQKRALSKKIKPFQVMKQVECSSGTTTFLNLVKKSFGEYLVQMPCSSQGSVWRDIAHSYSRSSRALLFDPSYSDVALRELVEAIRVVQYECLRLRGDNFTPILVTGPGEFEVFEKPCESGKHPNKCGLIKNDTEFVVHPFESSFGDPRRPERKISSYPDSDLQNKKFVADMDIYEKITTPKKVQLFTRLLIELLEK